MPPRRTKPVAERFNLVEIFAQDQGSCRLQRAANAIGFDQRVAVAVAANPGAELNQIRQSIFVELQTVDFAERFHDLGINLRQGIEQRKPKVAQAHANFVVDGGFRQAHFVGLPEGSHFRADIVFAILRFFGGQRKAVEALQLLRDAASLQQDGLPRDLRGMCREHWSDGDLAERGDGVAGRDSRLFHAQQRAPKRTRERRMFAVQFARAAPALAMVGLGKIGEFEVSREGFCDLIGAGQIHPRNNLLRFQHKFRRRSLLRTAPHGLAMLDQQPPQLFHRIEYVLTGLLHQHLSQDCAQRAHVSPQRIVFRRFVGMRRQFGQAGVLVLGFPQRLGFVRGHQKDGDRINDAARVRDEKSE